MEAKREGRAITQLSRLAAEFFARELAIHGILTVSRVALASEGRRATIFVTIFPDAAVAEGLHEARRLRRPLQEYIQEKVKAVRAPYLDVLIDNQTKRPD
ncbi:MAG: hypothetical protein AAB455_00685 [Patescibacteria group bacterium]